MKLYKYINNNIVKKRFLFEALKLDLYNKNIISFVGGGGKTTSIYTLARELSDRGRRVIVTTTTHMQMPKDKIVLNNNFYEVEEKIKEGNYITVGIKSDKDKIESLNYANIKKLIDICDVLLIEADGSKMLPLKAPESHEPVVLKESTMVIAVCGIDALGKEICDICHRPHKVAELINKELNECIELDDYLKILTSDKGQMKDVDISSMEYRVIINKADTEQLVEDSMEIAKRLYKHNIESVISSYIY